MAKPSKDDRAESTELYGSDLNAGNAFDASTEVPTNENLTDPTSDSAQQVVNIQVPNANNTRHGRAALVKDGVVQNVLMVVLDENDSVVGFEPEYGSVLVVLDDDSPVSPGWLDNNGTFEAPPADDE